MPEMSTTFPIALRPRPRGLRTLAATLFLALALLGALPAAAARWTWELSAERYKQMNLFERTQYDKAVKLFKDGNYTAAASEFEKFQAQFPDAGIISHILFMRGYSLHQAKTRNAAIKAYTDVLDYFGNVIGDAAPALYFTGIAYLDNGDTREGLKVMQEMIDDEDYGKHPLAAGAWRQIGDNYWRNKDEAKALTHWKKCVSLFWEHNPEEANAARASVTDYYIKRRDYSGYEGWLVSADNRANAHHRRWVAANAWERAWNGFAGDWGKYNDFNRNDKAEDMKAFWEYYKTKKDWYDQLGDTWMYYDRALHFLTQRWGEKKERDALIDEAVEFIKKIQDAGDANGKYAFIIDRLRDAGVYDRALFVADKMNDRPYAEYKKYEVYGRWGDWNKAVRCLEDIEKMGSKDWQMRAQRERARVYKDVLGKYEEAIKLYQVINEPPGTLWAVQECYRKWGKLKEALTTLSEIENSFPDQSSEAAWHKAWYLHEAGNSQDAISQARRILKVYPKTQASSRAHQLLEQYGIATGGGVVEEGT